MEVFWTRGLCSIREVQEGLSARTTPAYTTVQTTVYRLERKRAVQRVKKISNAHIFEAAVSRDTAQKKLIEELLSFFEGGVQPVMAHLIESGNLTLGDIQQAEKILRNIERKGSGK